MLIHIMRPNKHYDFVMDFVLDNLIEAKEIVKFKRNTGWATIGIDPVRKTRRERIANSTDKKTDSMLVR